MNQVRPRPSRPIAGRLAVASCLLALAAGCSGDDDDATLATGLTAPSTAAATTTTPVVTTAAPTTAAPTTVAPTTAAPTTAPPTETTSTPTTSSPSDTTMPDTLTGPDSPAAQAMVAALRAYNDAIIALAADPLSDSKLETTLALTTAEGTVFVQRYADILRRDGLEVRRNIDLPSREEVIESTITITADSGAIDVCEIDADLVIKPGANDDGSDEIVDDRVYSSIVSFAFTRIDGRWLVADRDTLSTLEDEEGCA